MKGKKWKGQHLLLKGASVFLSVILIYQLLLTTLPTVAGQMEKVALFSVGLMFPNGGWALLNQQPAQEHTVVAEGNSAPESSEEDVISSAPESSEEMTLSLEEEPDPPAKPENAGSLVRKTLTASQSSVYVDIGESTVKNLSGLSAQDVVSYASTELPFTIDPNSEEPQVLIYHTHATESYQPYTADWYDPSTATRSKDDTKNMIAVGDVLAQKLEAAGIGVIHDKTQHDNPSYTEGYDRSRATVQKHLKEHPSIKVVLDVHRDALQGDNVITAPYTEINGQKSAQIMTICCADNGTGRIPNYTKNFAFASALQNQMEQDYPTLARPMLFDQNRFYNQDLSVGSLLLEVGGHGNTLNEAKTAISFLADSLIKVLKGE